MTWVETCFGCPKRKPEGGQRCPVLTEKLKAIKGIGLTRIAFRCEISEAMFTPGQAVIVYRDDYKWQILASGVIWKRKKNRPNKWVVAVHNDEVCFNPAESDFYVMPVISAYANRIQDLDRPLTRVCIHCGKPEGLADRIGTNGNMRDYECRPGDDWDEENGKWKALPCVYECGAA